MKKIFLSSLLMLFGLTAMHAQHASQSRIEVLGTASQLLKADMILVEINVTHEAATAKAAQELTTETVTKAISYLKSKSGVKSLETNYISLRPQRIDYQKKDINYVSSQSIAFVLHDLSEYQNVIIDLLNMGVNGIGSVRFESSRREQMQKELLAKAITNAREKAGYMAAQLGQEIGKAVLISDQTHSGNGPVDFRKMDMMEASSIEPQELKISSEVRISFELK